MKKTKLAKLLLAVGFGVGLSGAVSALPNQAVCNYLEQQCLAGDEVACSSLKNCGRWL